MKQELEVVIGIMDRDIALSGNLPTAPKNKSHMEGKANYRNE